MKDVIRRSLQEAIAPLSDRATNTKDARRIEITHERQELGFDRIYSVYQAFEDMPDTTSDWL
jgi:hypothetical protein